MAYYLSMAAVISGVGTTIISYFSKKAGLFSGLITSAIGWYNQIFQTGANRNGVFISVILFV